jgi:hypothetical protein
MIAPVQQAFPGEGTMEFELDTNRKWRIASLLMTVAVVGGAIAYAMGIA